MTDAHWFYLDGQGIQQGPVDAPFLRDAVQRRALGPDSMLWREGIGSWRPLREVAEDLGLTAHPAAVSGLAAAHAAPTGIWTHIARTHPWYGLAACALASVAAVMMVLLIVLLGAASLSAHDMTAGSVASTLVTFCFDALNVLDGIAIGFGIVGVVQKDRSKTSSIIGVVIAAITVMVNMAP